MLNIDIKIPYGYNSELLTTISIEEKVKLLIIRDLFRLGWQVQTNRERVIIVPPINYDKETIRQSMAIRRNEILQKNKKWINAHIELGRKNLANGTDILSSQIKPHIEVCETQKQHDLFRLFRYYWSSPYSEYVGRRVKLLIRDYGLKSRPLIGIAALGSPIIHIPDRDNWVGWDKTTRSENLIYSMDAYVIGALPPYNYILGGKLISYILTSNEVRKIYREKYKDQVTHIAKRSAHDLVCIFTTSLYGRSSQYNRIRYQDRLLYIPIGETKGYGTLHLTEETFQSMLELLKARNILVANSFGDGPSWRMRVIRTVGDILRFDSDFLLQHSFKRRIYAVPLAKRYKEFLMGETKRPCYYNYSLNVLTKFWKDRWLEKRLKNQTIINQVIKFISSDFSIF